MRFKIIAILTAVYAMFSTTLIADSIGLYREAAERGDANAQYKLGLRYYKGVGVAKDTTEAVKWFRKAAELGNVKAQYELGHCYEFGLGVDKDYVETIKWFRKAAEQGDAEAQRALVIYYAEGTGVTKDPNESAKWSLKAAGQKNTETQMLDADKERIIECIDSFMSEQEKGKSGTEYWGGTDTPEKFYSPTAWRVLDTELTGKTATVKVRVDSSTLGGLKITITWTFYMAKISTAWKVVRIENYNR